LLILVKQQQPELTYSELLDAELYRRNLKKFVVAVWPLIDPAPFVDGYLIDAICEHLEAVSRGEILRLLINMPPRHAKSSIVSVLWRVWSWINDPGEQWLCASYVQDLAERDNRRCRNVIEHYWFQERYGHLFKLTRDQNEKANFDNDRGGYHICTSVGARSGTGKGGNRLLIDDPHPAHDGSLERKAVSRENALTWFKETWQSRLNDREKGAMVVVGQRIHQNDISGHILEQGGWEHLNLPAEFVPERRCSTSVVGNIWKGTDWRKLEGELLWKEKFSQESLDTLKHDMTILPYSCQFQQAPVPPGGFIFEQQYERWFTIDQEANLYLLETPDGIKPVVISNCKIIITSDVAAKAKEQSDFTVFCVWAITPAKEILLLYVIRKHLRIPKQIELGYQVYQSYRDDRFQAFHFEDVAYQGAFGQFMMEKGVPCEEFHPKGDKVVRAGGASIWMKLGNFYWLKNLVGLDVCRQELYNFNKDVHDDFVDNVSQICIIVKESKDIEPMDEETANVLREYAGY